MGAHGERIEHPGQLQSALTRALQRTGPTVLDVVVDSNELPPTLVRRVQTLGRFLARGRPSEIPPMPMC
jgi:thiamine pyrophosphate-dependent acetolactate synthase large subunit-like protein